MNKEIIYISPRDVRKNRADAVHIMLTCDALSKLGEKVTLLTPFVNRKEYIVTYDEIFDLYGLVNRSFNIKELKPTTNENTKIYRVNYSIAISKLLSHCLFIVKNFTTLRNEKNVVYSKCFISLLPYLMMKRLRFVKSVLIIETITPKKSWLHGVIYKNSDLIMSPLQFVTQELIDDFNVEPSRIVNLPFVTQADRVIEFHKDKISLREELNLDTQNRIILYAGKTGENTKEVDYFIESAFKCPELSFVIVGCNNSSMQRYQDIIQKRDMSNLQLLPFQPLPMYYKYVLAADILVGFYPATFHNMYHLSPGKSGIYLASMNPCIFSDLPSLRSIFPPETVLFAKSDDVNSLVESIQRLISNPEKALFIATNALRFAQQSSYMNFAKGIVSSISKNLNHE